MRKCFKTCNISIDQEGGLLWLHIEVQLYRRLWENYFLFPQQTLNTSVYDLNFYFHVV